MKKTSIALFGMLAAVSSITASAQPPAWFVEKHPEVKTMERMQARQELAARQSREKQKLALHEGPARHAMNPSSGGESHGS